MPKNINQIGSESNDYKTTDSVSDDALEKGLQEASNVEDKRRGCCKKRSKYC